ncbi:SDR family oxidoreductase [Chitinophaga sp. MM2321]|uniref:SDR family NAD(P)-dependent oxidoreductase n=1 Tax=Chitinophaga sp. MM2321 TaxID=3137178 RepID=UPI0032D58C3F
MSGKMIGKKVLVTGSGTGLGRETALEFARQGAMVVLHYAHSKDGAASAVSEITAAGGKATAIKADLQDAKEAVRLAREAIDFLGGIDVLVNNAGISMTLEFEQVTPEQYDTVYNVNVRAQFFIMQTVLPVMEAAGGGVIINLSSVHGIRACKGHSVYAGTKGAIIAHTRELAVELAPKGIRINAVAPGAVPVENQFKAAGTDDFSELGKMIPCGFPGTPLDIAKTIIFLASDDARYIVGQTIVVDGGTTSWMSFSDGFNNTGLRLGKGYVPGL